MIDKIKANELLDFYGVLLTDRQQDICDLYYREDLSYNEIAELQHVSRTAVYETITRCTQALNAYEDKLHMAKSHAARMKIYQQIRSKTDDAGILKLVDQCEDTEN